MAGKRIRSERAKNKRYRAFLRVVGPLLRDPAVRQMERYIQHADVTCLEHCMAVAYLSWRLCCRLGLEASAAARGGLLHDLFLYDWHTADPARTGLHGFTHPATALRNAEQRFPLSPKEREAIATHMWPLTLRAMPRCGEAWAVCLTDTLCTAGEVLRIYQHSWLHRRFLRLRQTQVLPEPNRPAPVKKGR